MSGDFHTSLSVINDVMKSTKHMKHLNKAISLIYIECCLNNTHSLHAHRTFPTINHVVGCKSSFNEISIKKSTFSDLSAIVRGQ